MSLVEELISSVDAIADGDDNLGLAINETWKNSAMKGYTPTPRFSFDYVEKNNRPFHVTYSMDEMAKSQVLEISRH